METEKENNIEEYPKTEVYLMGTLQWGFERGTHVVCAGATKLLVKVLKLGVEPGTLLLLGLDLLQQP